MIRTERPLPDALAAVDRALEALAIARTELEAARLRLPRVECWDGERPTERMAVTVVRMDVEAVLRGTRSLRTFLRAADQRGARIESPNGA